MMYDTSEQNSYNIGSIVINLHFDSICDKYHTLHAKTTFVLLLFWLLLIQKFLTNQGF